MAIMRTGGEIMKITNRILLTAIIICLPVISVLLTENAICRMPDFYVHEFTQAQVSEKVAGDMTDEELGQFFSDFMIGKTKTFSYTVYEAEWKQALFTKQESRYMADARRILNLLTAVMAGAIAITVGACIFFLSRKEKDLLRSTLKWSFGVYALVMAVLIPTFIHLGLPPSEKDSAMSYLLTERFGSDWIITGVVGSAMVMIALALVIWNLSKPKRMFS